MLLLQSIKVLDHHAPVRVLFHFVYAAAFSCFALRLLRQVQEVRRRPAQQFAHMPEMSKVQT
jgi:hypothetical protein